MSEGDEPNKSLSAPTVSCEALAKSDPRYLRIFELGFRV